MPITLDDVLRVLESPQARRIDFWLAGLHISPNGYARVAKCFREGRIGIDTSSDENKAHYIARWNVLFVPPIEGPPGPSKKALILHECTHAMVDLMHATAVDAMSEECAGYIAQLAYMKLSSGRAFHYTGGGYIGETIRLIETFRIGDVAEARLQWADFQNLRRLIFANPDYRKEVKDIERLTQANGIPPLPRPSSIGTPRMDMR